MPISEAKVSAQPGKSNVIEFLPRNVVMLPADQVLFEKKPQQLGRGGFSVVDLATYQGEKVAVKTITKTSNLSSDPVALYKAAVEEVSLLANFASDHIMVVYGVIKDQPRIVMKLVSNGNLNHAIIDQHEPLRDLEQRVKIISQVAEALFVVHSKGYLYVDIKSDNVLLDENYNAVLSDFGLSMRDAGTNRFAGTYGYMSHDVIRDNKITKFSEIYSLGVFFLEVLYFQSQVFDAALRFDRTINPPLKVKSATLDGKLHKSILMLLDQLQDEAESGTFMFQDQKTTLGLLSIVRQCLEWEPEKRITLDKVVAFFRPLFSTSKEASAVAEQKPSIPDAPVQPISTLPQEVAPSAVIEARVPVAPAAAETERSISESSVVQLDSTQKTPLRALSTFQPASKSSEAKEQTSWLSSMCKCLARRA